MALDSKEKIDQAKSELENLKKVSSDAKKAESRLAKLRRATFNSSTRTYKVDGKNLSTLEYNAEVAAAEKTVNAWSEQKTENQRRVKELEKSIKEAPVTAGYTTEQIALGKQYLALRKEADSIKATDLDSSLKRIEAFKRLRQFAEQNPDAAFKVRKGTQGSGNKQVTVVGFQTLSDRVDDIDRAIEATVSDADRYANQGVTESQRVYRRVDGKTKLVTETKVTNPTELERRRGLIDATLGAEVTPETQTTTGASGGSSISALQVSPQAQIASVLGPKAKAKVAKINKIISSGQRVSDAQLQEILGPSLAGKIDTLRGLIDSAIATGTGAGQTGGAGGAGGTGGGGGTGGTGRVPLTPEEKAALRNKRADARFEKAAQQLRQMAPQMAWILDIDATKYPDVRALLARAVKDRMFESAEGLQRFTNELNGTSFFTELRDKGTKQKIVGIVGDLGFDDSNLGKLLANATNLQWDDDTLALEVYKEAFRKNADGTYVHANAEARARKSNAYLRIQNIGTAYFNQLDDATVERVLTGGMIEQDVERQQRELAKSKYGHLANLIDQGLTMEAITRSYQDEAARLLERDVNDISMADAKYQTAYDFVDESGQKRLMTTGEWVRKLRTDSQYGWDKTENAKQEARQLSASIVQAFGRVS